MLKNQNIICISSIDWDFIWQGHQEIMSRLSQNGNRVLFIENTGVRAPNIRDAERIKNRFRNWRSGVNGIRKVSSNLYIYAPLVLPFPYSRFARWINRMLVLPVISRWTRIMDFNQPIFWVFLPTPFSLDIIKKINNKLVIYYCIDNFRVSSVAAKKIVKSEAALLKRSDLIFVTSKELSNYCRKFNDRVHFFPFAVDFEKFDEKRGLNNKIPDDLKGLRGPIIGYVGGIHKWIDLDLITHAARKFPGCSFCFVGPIQTDVSSLAGLSNVYFLGIKRHELIPEYIKNFDVGIIPYLIADYTRNVYPTKMNEYLAMGKPVVSTNLPEVRYFNSQNDGVIYASDTKEEFFRHIESCLRKTGNENIGHRISVARKNSWANRIEEMSFLIEEGLNNKGGPDWRESFVRLYLKSRRKALKLTAVSVCLYLLIFYTQILWFLASPLKIAQAPEEADCVVVFSGGVGESGQAVQGYEERVDYAVKLYKRKLANYLVFVSGYKYIFNEAEIMKSLAVNFGVPPEAIILEETATNTYEYVKCTKDILDKRKWSKVLLVSSPYHMGRVSLVARKIAPQVEFVYIPTESRFYSHPGFSFKNILLQKASLSQIKGIIHEYVGIAYYYSKGLI